MPFRRFCNACTRVPFKRQHLHHTDMLCPESFNDLVHMALVCMSLAVTYLACVDLCFSMFVVQTGVLLIYSSIHTHTRRPLDQLMDNLCAPSYQCVFPRLFKRTGVVGT